MLSVTRSAAYAGKARSWRPASATRWPMIGPSARANACSTNQGSVCASSFSVPPSAASPSSRTCSFHCRGSARNDGNRRGEIDRERCGVTPASGAFSSVPSGPMRKAATAGPTMTANVEPACNASLSRAHVSPRSIRLASALGSVAGSSIIRRSLLQRQRLFGLLHAGEQPSGRAVDRLGQIPDFDKRLWLRRAVFAYESIEPNACDMLPAFADNLENLGVERDNFGRHVAAACVDLLRHFGEQRRRHDVGQDRKLGLVVGGLQSAKLQLRLL